MKHIHVGIAAVIAFIVLSLPMTYTLTDNYLKPSMRTTYDDCPGLPTPSGSILHGILTGLIVLGVSFIGRKQKKEYISRPSNEHNIQSI
jgi:hypothetical protein